MTAGPDFSQGGDLDKMAPSPELARILDELAGPGRRCEGLSDDEVTGLMTRFQSMESWASAGKLAVMVELLRRRGVPAAGIREPGGLPRAWEETLNEEVMMALAVSSRNADKLIDLGWSLAARLPATAAALSRGEIDQYKASIIQQSTSVLDDDAAAQADAAVAGRLAGKTPGEIGRMIGRAAASADPEGAEKRRKDAEEKDARVAVWREPAGTAAIAAFGGKPDEVLAAEQAVQDLAAAYKKAGVTGTADQLRQRAMIDKLAGTDARGPQFAPAAGGAGTAGGAVAARINLTLPAMTVLGLAGNPGESPAWGTLDPALVRDLADRAAAAGDRSEWHLTLVDEHGRAVAHGCAIVKQRSSQGKKGRKGRRGKRVKRDGRSIGTLGLRLPGGRELEFTIHPIPVGGPCDHRYACAGHDPSDLLRHLTEVRDGTCTRPRCARPAARCDYEHTEPYEKGGLTCLCNGNPKCRRCHQVKQARGWVNRQILPGFHQWTTPAGRTYIKGPFEYIA